MRNADDRRPGRRLAFGLVAMLALAPALGACANTFEGVAKDSQKIFGTAGGSPDAGKAPASKGGWQNPE